MKLSADARKLLRSIQPYRDISMTKQMTNGFQELIRFGFIKQGRTHLSRWFRNYRLTPTGRIVRNLLLEIEEAQNHA